MKKQLLISLFLLSSSLVGLSDFTYAADQIIFEQSDGTIKEMKLDKEKLSSNNSDNSNVSIVDLNSTDSNKQTDIEDDPDVLFVQNEKPIGPRIDPWTTLVQSRTKTYSVLEERLKTGQNVNQSVADGNPMLILGAMQNNLEEVELALKYKANTHYQNKQGEIALHWAAGVSSLDVVKALLSTTPKDAALDINKTSKTGRTPLHFAAMYKSNTDIISFLIENKANVNAIDINGDTPGHYAAGVRNWDNLEILLKNGANLFLKNKLDSTVESMVLENADMNAMVRFYPYLSSDGKKVIKDKLGNFSNYIEHPELLKSTDTNIPVPPQLSILNAKKSVPLVVPQNNITPTTSVTNTSK